MKDRLRDLLSEVGESFDYRRNDVRNLSRYMAELEDLLELYRTFVTNVTLSMPADQAALRTLLKKTCKVLGPPPDKQQGAPSTGNQVAEGVDSGEGGRTDVLIPLIGGNS